MVCLVCQEKNLTFFKMDDFVSTLPTECEDDAIGDELLIGELVP
jgi:hypothetical protein